MSNNEQRLDEMLDAADAMMLDWLVRGVPIYMRKLDKTYRRPVSCKEMNTILDRLKPHIVKRMHQGPTVGRNDEIIRQIVANKPYFVENFNEKLVKKLPES